MFTVIFLGFAVLCTIRAPTVREEVFAPIPLPHGRGSDCRIAAACGHGASCVEARTEPVIGHDVVNGRTLRVGSERGRVARAFDYRLHEFNAAQSPVQRLVTAAAGTE